MRTLPHAVRRLGHLSTLATVFVVSACGGGGSSTTIGASVSPASTSVSSESSASLGAAASPAASDPAAVGANAGAGAGNATVTAWVRVANDGGAFDAGDSATVRYGDGVHWITRSASGAASCDTVFFGSDPAPWVIKSCERQVTVAAVTQTGTVPVVNTALLPAAAAAFDTPRQRALTVDELTSATFQTPTTDVGAFRETCSYSHMAFDDPIAHPGAPGASHLHTFVGNSGVTAASTAASIAGSGGSTCAGGTLNRTGYWMPSLVDMRTGQAIAPVSSIMYYKLGYLGVQAADVHPFPAGLRIIAGDANATPTSTSVGRFACLVGGTWQMTIPNCAVGDTTRANVTFPQCWDGVNLDSPDHKSHMAYATGTGCPADHPVALPEISIAFDYMNTEATLGDHFKLSSDNYAGTGGYSLHADWFGGWDPATMRDFVGNCLVASRDCHAYLLGDGNILY